MHEWQWIALVVYVVGFFVTPYLLGRFFRDAAPSDEDGCAMLAALIIWPIWVPLVFLLWLFIGLPLALLKKGQSDG